MRALTKAQVDAVFTLHADSVSQGAYYQSGGTMLKPSLTLLVFPLRPGEWDGVMLKPGDLRALIREAELEKRFQPAAGDYIQTSSGGPNYEVIAGVLDVTGSVWTVYCRRRLV